MPNRLFLNDGQGGFREAPDGGVGDDGLSYGLTVGDVDNDGDLDMLQGAQGESRSILYLNLGEGQFLDVTEGVGLADLAQGGHSLPVMGDFDNDGDLDLMISEALRLFLNNGDGNFTEVTEPFGVANSPRGALWLTIGDYTGDGFLDVATGIGLSRNNGNSNHFLRVELAGVQSNRNGIGARVIATSGDLEQTRQILGGSGIVQAEMVAHFGLGSRTGVDRLEVRWPSGQVTVLENLPVDQQIRVIEGRDEYHVVRPTSWETAPPAGLPAGSTTRFAVEVRPALFEPGANITSVSADLSALGRPELVPLAPTGNGTYRLTTFLDVDERRSLREVSIAIEQNTSLGPHWTELSRTIAVAAPTDLALFGDMVAGEWTLNRQWLTNLSQHDAEDGLLWWAPDGQQIGFHSNREGNWEIYVMDVDGSNLVNLTNHPNPDGGATWSPDGTKILFNPIRRGTYRIHVMDADGSNVVELVEHPEFHGFPRWSPDGRQIAFSSTRDGGSSELYVMDADGSNIVRLTHHPHWDGFSRWSPDGQKIAFVSYRDGSGEFYILDLDAAEQVVLHPDERGVVYEGQTALRVEAAEPDVGESWKVLYRASERLDLAGYTTLRFAFHPGDRRWQWGVLHTGFGCSRTGGPAPRRAGCGVRRSDRASRRGRRTGCWRILEGALPGQRASRPTTTTMAGLRAITKGVVALATALL